MKLKTISYFIQEATRSIVRNSLMSVTSVVTVSACVFMLVFVYCVIINIDHSLSRIEGSVGVLTVFIEDDTPAERVTALYNEISAIQRVANVEYVSSEKAFEHFADSLGEYSSVLSGLETANVLRSRFLVKLDSLRYQDLVLNQIDNIRAEKTGIYQVNEALEIGVIITISNIIRIVSVIIVLLLLTLSIIIIVNTIKLAVNNRRNEIGIMKYIGATDWFVKLPFVIEGVFIGTLGAVLPIMLFGLGYDRLAGFVVSWFQEVEISAQYVSALDIFPAVMVISVMFGSIIGIAGSLLSIRRYLNV